jgi:hypothetical protein
MIVIYHIDSKRPISRHTNHDQAASMLLTMKDQNVLSTHNLAIAEENELEYMNGKTTSKPNKRPQRRLWNEK